MLNIHLDVFDIVELVREENFLVTRSAESLRLVRESGQARLITARISLAAGSARLTGILAHSANSVSWPARVLFVEVPSRTEGVALLLFLDDEFETLGAGSAVELGTFNSNVSLCLALASASSTGHITVLALVIEALSPFDVVSVGGELVIAVVFTGLNSSTGDVLKELLRGRPPARRAVVSIRVLASQAWEVALQLRQKVRKSVVIDGSNILVGILLHFLKEVGDRIIRIVI
mmetsp:Transcript_21102/g.32698  ORF Transcript_21102/g.32698 Transcript_21102/m.32698 type:complete len:233 (-) Transcript_21102:3195-3893(-)